MTRIFLLVAFALGLLPMAASAATCDDRTGTRGVALLVGVSNYRAPETANGGAAWGKLDNAINDVEQVCAKLAEQGFATWILRDPTYGQLDSAIFDFSKIARTADYAVVYYAGHGFEFRGQSYIVPVDAPGSTTLGALKDDFLPLSRLTNVASSAREFGLFLLDACRTRDPVVEVVDAAPTDDGPGQVDLIDLPNGAVLYSTRRGKPALDAAPRGSQLSPFASAVLAGLDKPGELTDFYAAVHDGVERLTEDMPPEGPQLTVLYRISPAPLYLVEPQVTANAPAARIEMPPLQRLATVDEPSLIREILRDHSLADLIGSATAGDPAAQYLVGYAYEFGVGVRIDMREAQSWLEKSAAQNHPGGLLELAYFLEHEAGDQARARQLYEQAAATGYAKAQSHLASYLWNGSYSEADPAVGEQRRARALELFKQASAAGHVYATFWLASYAADIAPELGPPAAARLRQLAAAGDPAGILWTCELHYQAHEWSAAAEQCLLAASRGPATQGAGAAQARLAQLHAAGNGVPQSAEQARYWAKLALTEPELLAELGDADFAQMKALAQ